MAWSKWLMIRREWSPMKSCPPLSPSIPPQSPPLQETPAEDHTHTHSHLSAHTRTCAYSDAHRHTHRYPHTLICTHTILIQICIHVHTYSHGQEPAHTYTYTSSLLHSGYNTKFPCLAKWRRATGVITDRSACQYRPTVPAEAPKILDPTYLRDQKRRPRPQLRPPHS